MRTASYRRFSPHIVEFKRAASQRRKAQEATP